MSDGVSNWRTHPRLIRYALLASSLVITGVTVFAVVNATAGVGVPAEWLLPPIGVLAVINLLLVAYLDTNRRTP